jgi:HK97 family phage major capsid protein
LRTGGLAEVVATRELIRALAAAFDKAALCGSGAAGQPLGVVLTPGVDSRNGATFATATATAMLSAVESGNAEPTAWITTPAVAALLRARAKNGTGSEFLIDGSGRMMNLPVYVTTGVDAGTLILGDFRQLSILAESVQIELDRTTNATTGICRLFLFGFGDIAVHHPAAFAVATSVT